MQTVSFSSRSNATNRASANCQHTSRIAMRQASSGDCPLFDRSQQADKLPKGSLSYTVGTAVGGTLAGVVLGGIVGYWMPGVSAKMMAAVGAIWGFVLSDFQGARQKGSH